MNTTPLLAASPSVQRAEVPDVATCMRRVQSLKALQETIEVQRADRIAALGKNFEAVADGGELDSEVLLVIAEETAKGELVKANLAEAERVLAVAVKREVQAQTLAQQDKAEAIARRLEQLGVKLETAADELCRLLALTGSLGQEAVQAFRDVGRLDDTLTEDGYIATSDITDIASTVKLQSIVERHMNATLGYWRSDTLMTMRSNPRLAESMAGMAQSLRNTAGLLLDLDVTEEEIQSIRRYMASRADSLTATGVGGGNFTH